MTTMEERERKEPSTFALDVYWASGRSGNAGIERHLKECERCRAYLSSLDARLEAAPAKPATPSVRGLGSARRVGMGRWLWPATGGIALAAGVLFLVRGRSPSGDYIATKGTPAVQLLVHRDGDTRVWDGRSPVHPGDALALRVACEGLGHVAVAAPGPDAWVRLSDAPCPAQADALPFTLRVDDQPGDERLAVVLSRTAMGDAQLRAAIAETTRSDDAWVVGFVLPKETGSQP
jgi:hypothetical protein